MFTESWSRDQLMQKAYCGQNLEMIFFKASTKFEPIASALLVWLSYNWSHWKGMQEAKVHNFFINRNVTNRVQNSVYKKESKLNDCNLFKQIFHWTSNLNPFSVNRWVSQKKPNHTKDLIHIVEDLFRFALPYFLFSTVSASLVWSFEWLLLFLRAFVFY